MLLCCCIGVDQQRGIRVLCFVSIRGIYVFVFGIIHGEGECKWYIYVCVWYHSWRRGVRMVYMCDIRVNVCVLHSYIGCGICICVIQVYV